jgi:predicted transcriptional regulator
MSTVKQEVEALLQRLPDDCTYEDIQYHLYVLEKIRRGTEDIEAGRVVPHEDVVREFEQWRIE